MVESQRSNKVLSQLINSPSLGVLRVFFTYHQFPSDERVDFKLFVFIMISS